MKKIAVDTNVVVRMLADDGSEQCRIAADLPVRSRILISKTVMLETEWILRGVMKANRERVNFLLSGLLLAPNIEIEQAAKMQIALAAHAGGMDFADALHVAALEEGSTFQTFDKDLVKHARTRFKHISVELAQ